jgi:predicted nucleic acid-binding protein
MHAPLSHSSQARPGGRTIAANSSIEAASGVYLAFTSSITLAEVTRKRHHPVDPGVRQQIEKFFENPYIETVNADRFTVLRARELIWQHLSLRPNDAIHLASALRANCTLYYT